MSLNHHIWKTRRVGESLRLVNGRAFKPAEWTTSGLPIVRIQNLNNPEAPFNFFSGTLPEKFRLADGDLLFAWSGTPGTSFGAHIWRGGQAWLNQHIFKVEFDQGEFDKRFLRYAINQNLAEYIRLAHGGAGLAHITKGKFESSEIPCPPLPEQRRIVAEIEKQFTRLDAAIASLRRVESNLKRYRASVLKSACEGKLVPTEAVLVGRDRRARRKDGGSGSPALPFETGEQMLQRILKHRRENWQGRGKYKEPAAPDITNLPALPEGWCWCSSDSLFSLITSGSRGWAQHYAETGAIFLRIGNLDHENIRLDLRDVQKVVPPPGAEGTRTLVKPDDLLISITADVGMVALVPPGLGEAYINQHVALARPVLSEVAAYVAYFMSSAHGGCGQMQRLNRGATKLGLGLDDLRSIHVPLPPLAEQKRIVAEVERRLSVVDALSAQVATSLQRATRLRQSILQRAFAGALVKTPTEGIR